MKVRNKVFVVTGAGSGIGRQLTLELLRRDASVAALDVNPKTLQETAALAGGRAQRLSTVAGDIADRTAVEAFPATVLRATGRSTGSSTAPA